MVKPPKIYSSTEPVHLEKIYSIIVERGYTLCAELGTHIGGSLMYIASAIQENGGGTAIGIDHSQELLNETRKNFNKFRDTFPDVELITHCEKLPSGINRLPDNLDFVFIDDLHDADHVAQELDMLMPKMKVGSTITGHDISNPAGIGEAFLAYNGKLYKQGFGLGELVVK
ncbi:MAG: class I SAM-dependent methyltransferase [Candidatus Thorarchaeota archaeon]|jgi:predicted O-methyltransferase YrrM